MAGNDRHVAERVGAGVVAALCFGVGMLVGGQTCAPEPSKAPEVKRLASGVGARSCVPRVVERVVTSPPKIIYQCPPEPEPPPRKEVGAKKGGKKALPAPEPDLDPLERQRLLAWVREHSEELKPCRDNRQDVYRMAVILHLDRKTRKIRRVDVNATRGELPGGVKGCLRRRIGAWKIPRDLIGSRTKLVFGLNL